MRILHYALGFPPYRTGGLTKYCMDLMRAQKAQGNEVGLLWPGKIGIMNHKLAIKRKPDIEGIHSFEVINPLPISLDEGILDIEAFMVSCDKEVYVNFLKTYAPDAIHLHTLMGLHRELVNVAQELNIRTVFTTHDYFGICPKVTLYNKSICDDDHDCKDCIVCNQTALSKKKIILMQSFLYRIIKNTFLVKLLRRKHRNHFYSNTTMENCSQAIPKIEVENLAAEYRRLRKFYTDILETIDVIHFNSTISEMVYQRYIVPKSGRIISITHGGIADHRKKKDFDHEKLRIAYLAPAKPYKGFNMLKQALDELWADGHKNFILNIYNLPNQISPYMQIQDGYQYSELGEIFDKTDLLVAPSMWYETFGFTVLEATSYGVPVLVNENVGAKDLLPEQLCVKNLKEVLDLFLRQKRDVLSVINQQIISHVPIKLMTEHVNEITELYY